jgi:hypothetical protein
VLADGDEGDRRVGEQHDRARTGGQAVETVGQVDAVGAAGDDQEDEYEVEHRPDVEAEVEGPDQDHRFQTDLVACDPPEDQREEDLPDQLVAGGKTEGAAFDDLDEVVGEAQRGASDRHEEDRHRCHPMR